MPPLSAPASDWIDWGGELIFAVDFTSGGAPIGLTLRQIEEMLDLQSLEQERPHDDEYPPDWDEG